MKAVLVIATALTLSACASSKNTVPQQPPADTYFEVGQTTYSEVIKLLGEPNDSTRHADGSRSVHYFRSQSLLKTECVTPYGTFRGGSEVKSDLLSMTFDKGGLLANYSAISGKTLTGASPPGAQRQASR
ncbi:hypothetical protein [Hyalangium sp.]|uniref:hypothetical protein n=1 Tax=Hyalangium sp. TaxID=2028555 RepID=UPI002D43D437|nr:hypothetical protein [Hyalangium sp.]HYH96812.1 hypothetical protein [Hyalangium sp.]